MSYLTADLAVEAILNAGVSLLLTDDAAWDLILHDVPAAERVVIRTRFRQGVGRTPTVLLGYPRANSPWPIWAVYLAMEAADAEFMGKGGDGAQNYDVEDDEGHDVEMAATAQRLMTKPQVGVVVATINAKETAIQSVIAGRLILSAFDLFVDAGFADLSFVNRGDLAPDPTWLTENIWAREQRWTLTQEESAARELGDGIALVPPVRGGLPDVDFGGGDMGIAVPETP